MNFSAYLTFCGFIFIQLLNLSRSFVITVDAHNEECFFERAEGGTKLGLTFEVIEGGFLDVDIKITGPDQNVIHQSEKESSGKLTFAAPKTGVYTVCFNNEKSSMTPKVVMFSIDIGEASQRAPGAPGEEEAGHTKLEDMIRELSGTLTSVKHEQEYMHVSPPYTCSQSYPCRRTNCSRWKYSFDVYKTAYCKNNFCKSKKERRNEKRKNRFLLLLGLLEVTRKR